MILPHASFLTKPPSRTQRPRPDTLGLVWELLPAAEGGHRAGLHAGADCRAGAAVLPLLHPLAAGQDHRGSSQQGAAKKKKRKKKEQDQNMKAQPSTTLGQ